MEATLQTVERLIEGTNGEDPAGACMYMSQLRENEVSVLTQTKARLFKCVVGASCLNSRWWRETTGYCNVAFTTETIAHSTGNFGSLGSEDCLSSVRFVSHPQYPAYQQIVDLACTRVMRT